MEAEARMAARREDLLEETMVVCRLLLKRKLDLFAGRITVFRIVSLLHTN